MLVSLLFQVLIFKPQEWKWEKLQYPLDPWFFLYS